MNRKIHENFRSVLRKYYLGWSGGYMKWYSNNRKSARFFNVVMTTHEHDENGYCRDDPQNSCYIAIMSIQTNQMSQDWKKWWKIYQKWHRNYVDSTNSGATRLKKWWNVLWTCQKWHRNFTTTQYLWFGPASTVT